MSVPLIPPLPVEPDLNRPSTCGEDCDFVDGGAVRRVVLGIMPTGGDAPMRPVPPANEFAGRAGVFPAPAIEQERQPERRKESRLPATPRAEVAPPRPPERVAGPVFEPVVERAPEPAVERPAEPDRPTVNRRPRHPRPPSLTMASRRPTPPVLDRPSTADPEAEFGKRDRSLSGLWVMLSSAAASVLLFLLTSVALTRSGSDANDPGLSRQPQPQPPAEASTPTPPRSPGLAASRLESR